MSIHEIFERAEDYAMKNSDGGFKFKPVNLPEGAKEVTFEVIDAFFGFITYEGLDGFCTKHHLRSIYGESMKYEIV